MAQGYVLNEATGKMEYRTDLVPGVPDVTITIGEDRLPVEESYQDQYEKREAEAYARNMMTATPEARGSAPPSTSPTSPVPVDVAPEALARNAEAARQIPAQQQREQLAQDLKEPSVRGAVNTILSR